MWGTSGRMRDGVRRWRPVSRYGVAAAVAVAAVALMVGSASASPSALAATTKYTAPYTGESYSGLELDQQGCGQTATASVLPFLNLTSGKVTADAKTTSKSCGTTNSTVEIILYSDYESASFTGTAGSHNLTAIYSLSLKVNLTAKPGGTGQVAYGYIAVAVGTSIFDETNQTTFSSDNGFQIEAYEESGSYLHTYSALKAESWVEAKLVKSHSYVLGVDLVIYLFSGVTPGTSKASATLTMAGGKDAATLKSISFS